MAQITVNGRVYEMVSPDDLTLGEARVARQLYGFQIDRAAEIEGFDAAAVSALIHMAVARAEPGETPAAIQQVVDQIKITDLERIFIDMSVEVEELPPPSTDAEPLPSVGSGETSNVTSEPSPDNNPPDGSGSRGWDTGLTFDPVISTS